MARRRVGPEVLGQIGKQGLAVFQREAPLRVAVGDDAVAVGEGRPVGQRLPEHLVNGRLPRRRAGRPGREEVPAVARHARPLRDVAAGPRRIQLVVGQVLRCRARRRQLTAAAGRGWGRGVACRPQRKRQTGAVARVQHQVLHVRLESGRQDRNLVAAGEQRHGPKTAGLRVRHVQHPPVHVPDKDPRRRERGVRRDRAGQGRRVGHLDGPRGAGRRHALWAGYAERHQRDRQCCCWGEARRQPPFSRGSTHDGPPACG